MDLLCSHNGTQMESFRISPCQIFEIELGESIMGFPVTGRENLVQGDPTLKSSRGCKCSNIMRSDLMQGLRLLIRQLVTQNNCLINPRGDSSRHNILLETLTKGYKHQLFTSSAILGPIQIVSQGSNRAQGPVLLK